MLDMEFLDGIMFPIIAIGIVAIIVTGYYTSHHGDKSNKK